MKKRNLALFFAVGVFLAMSLASSAEIADNVPIQIQSTDSQGNIETGTFDFTVNVSETQDCSTVVYSNTTTRTTDNRGIVAYNLKDVNLDFDKQYWFCHYVDGSLEDKVKAGRSPYAFTAENLQTSEGLIQNVSDINGSDITNDLNWINSSQVGSASFWNRSNGNIYPDNLTDNVGIGTDSPSYKLDVNGSAIINTTNTGVSKGLILRRNLGSMNANSNLFEVQKANGNVLGTIEANGVLNFNKLTQMTGSDLVVEGSGSRGVLTLKGGGNGGRIEMLDTIVGIGTSSPNAKLEVNGTTNISRGQLVIDSEPNSLGNTPNDGAILGARSATPSGFYLRTKENAINLDFDQRSGVEYQFKDGNVDFSDNYLTIDTDSAGSGAITAKDSAGATGRDSLAGDFRADEPGGDRAIGVYSNATNGGENYALYAKNGDINLQNQNNAYQFNETDILRVNLSQDSIAVGDTNADTSSGEITAVGARAGKGVTGDRYAALGRQAGASASGSFSAVGFQAGESSGTKFSSIGYGAGQNSGNKFSASGYLSGSSGGSDYVSVGYRAGKSGGNKFISIGSESSNPGQTSTPTAINDSIAIGYESAPQYDGHFVLQQANLNSNPLIQGNFSSGNVGIGLSNGDNFTSKLEVGGDINSSGTVYANNFSSNSPLRLQTGGTTRMYFDDSSGNVGIGTSSPDRKLEIEDGDVFINADSSGSGRNRRLVFGEGGNKAWSWSFVGGSGDRFLLSDEANRFSSGRMVFGSSKGSTIGRNLSSSNEGTDDLRVWDRESGASTTFSIRSGDSQSENLFELRNGTGSPLSVFDSDGRVGIGNSNPDATLDVDGNTTFGGQWEDGGAEITGGDVYAQTGYFYNITSLNVSSLNVNGSSIPSMDDTFDLGNSTDRWKSANIGTGGINSSGDVEVDGDLNTTGKGYFDDVYVETGSGKSKLALGSYDGNEIALKARRWSTSRGGLATLSSSGLFIKNNILVGQKGGGYITTNIPQAASGGRTVSGIKFDVDGEFGNGISRGFDISGSINPKDNSSLTYEGISVRPSLGENVSDFDAFHSSLGDVLIENGSLGIGTTSPNAKLDVQGGNINLNSSHALQFDQTDILRVDLSSNSIAVGDTSADIDSNQRLSAFGERAAEGISGTIHVTAIGRQAARNSGTQSTAIGDRAGLGAGDEIAVVGQRAGKGAGSDIAALGRLAGDSAGKNFLAQGYSAGRKAGDRFTALGYQSSYDGQTSTPSGISDSVAIGYKSAPQYDGNFLIQQANLGDGSPILQGDLNTDKLGVDFSNNATLSDTFNVNGTANITGNVTSQTDFCIEGGNCLSNVSGRGASNIWNETSSEIYPSDTDKKVGVGTDEPNETLDVKGNFSAEDGETSMDLNSEGGVTIEI